MLYLVEVPDSILYLESRLKETAEKNGTIDAVAGRVEGLPIQELLERVDTLEVNVGRTVNYKYVNARLNLTMRAITNQALTGGTILVSTVKISEPKSFCGERDAKTLENYIFDLEQCFRATNTVTEEAKVTLATMHLSKDAKLWWRSRYIDMQEGRCTIDTWDTLKKELRSQFFPENVRRKLRLKPWAKTKLYEQRVQDLMSVYAAAEWLFDLVSDSQDVRRHQSSSPRRNRNSRSSSPKAVRGDKRSSKDRRPYQSNIENT
ncbi:uncharacterized protein E6C27_scaffold22G002810 [Cucumis melo var. makuwa]|uniref:Retrotransposon gag domain-containing protein n=1 Tax=Cucumis melo var. makuwa TaxID=1194695 RepID=A0A5A7UZJ5_CUCMM|nr:uncharacterized protein E6C27_scaffold22G002810 [Cucumis melo var. makuwa]